jgi:hypothetical protein
VTRTVSLAARRARQAAQEIHRRFFIRRPEQIDAAGLAWRHSAQVVRGELRGAVARLVHADGAAVIRLSSDVTDPGAQQFSIAHELGHLVLRHASADAVDLCAAPSVHGFIDAGAEAEANAFAAELLMPESMVRRRCEVSPVSLEPARGIAHDHRVSLMAAALRFVELTSERCALVFSRDRRVVWASRSATFAPFIERGRRVDAESLAIDAFVGRSLRPECEPVPADAWFDHEAAGDVDIWEHACAVPEMHGVLSLLWIPETVAHPFDRA